MPLTPEEEADAIALVNALNNEFEFPVKPRPADAARWVGELHNKVPARKDIGDFQTQTNNNPNLTTVPKAIMGPEISDSPETEEEIKHLFCVVHGEYTITPNFDVEHSVSVSEIRNNQIGFLDFLNSKIEFSDFFLAQSNVSNFFRRDVDGKIKGSTYFYKICYNDADNLWLLCHGCNITKSNKSSLEWFREQEKYFGEAFVKEVEKRGGLTSGVILNMIGGDYVTTLTINKEERKIYTGGTGLGKFARDWFLNKHPEEFEMNKEALNGYLRDIKNSWDHIRKLLSEDKKEEARRELKDLKKKFSYSGKIMNMSFTQFDSDSGELSPAERNIMSGSLVGTADSNNQERHHLALLKKLIKNKFSSDHDDIKLFFRELLKWSLNQDMLDYIHDLRSKIQAELEANSLVDWPTLKMEINESLRSLNKTKMQMSQELEIAVKKSQEAEQAKQKAEQATQKAEQARQRAEQATQKAEQEKQEEKQKREEAEQATQKAEQEKQEERQKRQELEAMLARQRYPIGATSSSAEMANRAPAFLSSGGIQSKRKREEIGTAQDISSSQVIPPITQETACDKSKEGSNKKSNNKP